MRNSPPEEEGAAEASEELTMPPFPSPCGEAGRELRSGAEPGKKGGVNERYFKTSFYFSFLL